MKLSREVLDNIQHATRVLAVSIDNIKELNADEVSAANALLSAVGKFNETLKCVGDIRR